MSYWDHYMEGHSQWRSLGMGGARQRRKALKAKIIQQKPWAEAERKRLAMTDVLSGRDNLATQLQASINKVNAKKAKQYELALELTAGNIVFATIKADKPTETIMSMQRNGFWTVTSYGYTRKPAFILPFKIDHVWVTDVVY